MATLTWIEFLSEAENFIKISESLGDNWTLFKKNDNEGNSFLIYKQKITATTSAETIYKEDTVEDTVEDTNNKQIDIEVQRDDLLQFEYHVVYSISYKIPILYFRAYRSDGSQLELEEVWTIFQKQADLDDSEFKRDDMLNILTQMDHPVLFKPFFTFHPCRITFLLSQAGISRNRILTFISLYGPYVQLNIKNEYGFIV